MRGKVPSTLGTLGKHGITPAYAGKSVCCRIAQCLAGDHPRVCGEKSATCPLGRKSLGSPPRMRGKAWTFNTSETPTGITPAYAGKRSKRTNPYEHAQDHPRVCGEKPALPPGVLAPPGSPPRMRGKESFEEHGFVIGGITPAYAGKRGRQNRNCKNTQDHPRVCGEKWFWFFVRLR